MKKKERWKNTNTKHKGKKESLVYRDLNKLKKRATLYFIICGKK